MTRASTILLACLALAQCAPAGGSAGGYNQADASTLAACRQRADDTYDRQNRADIYRPQAAINTPSSATYVPGDDGRGLSQSFAHDTMVRDCVRTSGLARDQGAAPVPGAAVKR